MNYRRRVVRLIVILSYAIGAALALDAQTPLADSSPFSPPDAASLAASGSSAGLELRGIMGTDDGIRFCIYDTNRGRSVWVGLKETGYPFFVRSADLAHDAVTVDWRGQCVTLPLRKSKVSMSANPERRPVPSAVAYSRPEGGSPSLAPMRNEPRTPEEKAEAARTQAMLEELLRRRTAEKPQSYSPGADEENPGQ